MTVPIEGSCSVEGAVDTSICTAALPQHQGCSSDPRARVRNSMAQLNAEFILENDVSLVYPLTEEILQLVADFYGGYEDSYRFQLAISIEESITNAMIHGNLEISSALLLSSDTAGEQLIAQRTGELPFCVRRVFCTVSLGREQLLLLVRDQGPGFDVDAVPDPTAAENLDQPCGRGLLLMRNFMDSVIHNEIGNALTMMKRAP